MFRDRRHAGQVLAGKLQHFANQPGVVVLALPRGGVPIGFEIAHALHAPLDIFLVRKLGMPGHEEFALGAIASGGVRVLNPDVDVRVIPQSLLDELSAREQRELERREAAYRGDRPPIEVRGQIVIVVDDGLATGSSMHAAVVALRQKHPARIVIAVPVGAPDTCAALQREVDEVVCAVMPEPFYAVGLWYEHFSQIQDEEVCALLRQASEEYDAVTRHAA